MIVGCWLSECKWNKNGWCDRGSITIDELKECEDYEDYQDSYTDSFWKAMEKDGKPYRKLVEKGKKIEYNGYVFYTEEKITDDETYCLTEERTGINSGEFIRLKDQRRWEFFLERVGTYPDVSTYPIEEKKGGEE
jgi:hypothetical protein